MRFAIFESILTPGGHEVDFDRIITEEIQALGHEISFYVPSNFTFKHDYKVPVHRLAGEGVSYEGVRGLRKMLYSLKREMNRQRWFRQLYACAKQGKVDAIIIPTSTYRYLRALNMNILRKSPVPVIFVVHGINPGEAPRFFAEASKLQQYSQIKMAVLTFGDNILGKTMPNVYCIKPPTYKPRDIQHIGKLRKEEKITLGFFGQYRREKNLDAFLDVFLACEFTHPVEIFVQGATVSPADGEDFQRIMKKYNDHQQISFLHKGLFGKEWQEAVGGVDALVMPYSSSRYLYHWAGMLFTAIGYTKPVVASSEINPEILNHYGIGVSFEKDNRENLRQALEQFVNTYADKVDQYERELIRAGDDYSPRNFAQQLVQLAQGKSI